MNKTSRAIAAFAVAPFVPTSLAWTWYQVQSRSPAFHGMREFWDTVNVVFAMSVVVTVPLTLAIGIPAYVLIERRSTLRRQQVLGISGFVGFAVGLLLASPVIGTLLGLSAGITFWLIWHRARDAKSPF